MGVERLAASLTRLQDALADVRLPLELPGAAESRELIQRQTAQIDDYVLPRLRRLDAPLLVVVGGSTGAGKSTLVNSLVGRVVSEAGVIRPTTRSSVLVHHPDDRRWFASGQILPGLARSEVSVTDPRVLQLVAEPGLPRGLAILDAPDVDSVVAQNRTLAAQLLGAGDLWLFVTSAARYADAVPWKYLRAAARRKAVVAVVLDRVPPVAIAEVPPHLGQMMSQRGLSASPLFAVPETAVTAEGLLPGAAVAPIREWLADLAEDTVRRNQVVLQTLDGAVEALVAHSPEIVQAVQDQVEGLATLRSDAEKSFAEAVRSVAAQTADGTLLRGEVLARWQDFVGTGEFFRAVEKRIGLFRDRLARAVRGEPKKAQDVALAVESGLEVLIREEGEFAARRVVSAWEAHPAGRQLLARDAALGRVSSDFAEAAARVIRQWQGDVLEMVATEGASKKAAARYLALGVNGAGVALMVFIFSQTGGLLGAEVGIAGGTAVLAQRLLEAVFGEDAVRRMARNAKEQLDARVEALMAAELLRFVRLVDDVEVRPEQAEQFAAAIAAVEVERAADDRYLREVPVGELPVPEAGAEVSAASLPVGEIGAAMSAGLAAQDDTGLLPALVSAQLSALAADAARHADDDDDSLPDLVADPEVDEFAVDESETVREPSGGSAAVEEDHPSVSGDHVVADAGSDALTDLAGACESHQPDADASAGDDSHTDMPPTGEPDGDAPADNAAGGTPSSDPAGDVALDDDPSGDVVAAGDVISDGLPNTDLSNTDLPSADLRADGLPTDAAQPLPSPDGRAGDGGAEAGDVDLESDGPAEAGDAVASSVAGGVAGELDSDDPSGDVGSEDDPRSERSGVAVSGVASAQVVDVADAAVGVASCAGSDRDAAGGQGDSAPTSAVEDDPAAADADGASDTAEASQSAGSGGFANSDDEPWPTRTEPEERPIPVPAGLAELAAEAVRKPWEPRWDDADVDGSQAGDEPTAVASAEDGANEPVGEVSSVAEPADESPGGPELPGAVGDVAVEDGAGPAGGVSGSGDAAVSVDESPRDDGPTGGVADGAAPAETAASNGAHESSDVGLAQNASMARELAVGDPDAVEQAAVGSAPVLPGPPVLAGSPEMDGHPLSAVLPLPPAFIPSPRSAVTPISATDTPSVAPADGVPELSGGLDRPAESGQANAPELPTVPALPSAPPPVPATLRPSADPAAVPLVLLVPPDGIPAAPPVPSWPDTDDDPVARATEEDLS